ncbi:uncharacterized protein LOC114715948, partial [Neltuma alba]|uniref:uncharacterized protein LOC114715948 n=1 Tax=Neltuma alba TaxID=207710 RepID=UPI0010A3C888
MLNQGEADVQCMVDSPKHHTVAMGRMFNLPGESMIHNVPLPVDHVRVQLNTAIDANYALPMPTPDAETVAQAVVGARLERGEDFMIPLEFKLEVYGRPTSEYVTNEVLKEILTHGMAGTNACNFYIRYLFKNFIVPSGLDDKFKIVSSHTFAGHGPDMKKKDLSGDLGHWMLIVVNSIKPRIWALWLYHTNQALPCPLVKNGQFDDTFPWKKVKCPRQPKKSSDCGYCVMKFIKEIIMHNADTIPIQYFADTYCVVYSSAQMEEIIEELAIALFRQW